MEKSRILLVDDDVDFTESQAEFLETQGFDLTAVFNGEDALLKATETDFDIVLLDMKMPGMNGIECLTELRRIRPGIKVAMVSAFSQNKFIKLALESGAFAVLNKPVVPEVLLETLSFLGGEASILVVEDDPDLREVISSTIRKQGYSVKAAGSVAEARHALSHRGFDLVLLDFQLPDGTGEDLLDWMADSGRPTRTLILTGYPAQAMAALPCFSVEDLMVKPFEPEELLKMIRRHDPRKGAA